MRCLALPALAAAALLAMLAVPSAVQGYTNPITIKGYKMFDAKTGDYFSVKGIDYYPRPNTGDQDANNLDFFTDDYYDVWKDDIQYLAAAGANAVRLYAVDPSQSHDLFMCALRSHGMYALVDLASSCDGCAIIGEATPDCYPANLKYRGQQIINAFSQYDNVLAFSAGNEVNNVVSDPATNGPCQKKFIRDMRAYIASCGTLRSIPVGVVLADADREENALYYNCRSNASDEYENAEWFGINTYQYCDASITVMENSGGFMELLTDFVGYDYSIPVLLTEFGCLSSTFPTEDGYEAQRTWLQAGWLHTSTFREAFSGGFAFEYSTENANSKSTSAYPFTSYGAQNYGLGYFSPEDCDHTTTACVYNPMLNYNNLATQYNASNTSGEVAMDSYTPESTRTARSACPSAFAALSDIDWSTVEAVELTCPTSAVEYTCPGQTSSGTWTASTASASKTSESTATGSTDSSSTTDSSGTGGTSTTSSASTTPIASLAATIMLAAMWIVSV